MTDREAGQYWNKNAETWTILARGGYDVYRDHLNTPAFFDILPEVKSLSGIDIGCGEGYNTRLLAKKGANIKAIDISETFIKRAGEMELQYLIIERINEPCPDDEKVKRWPSLQDAQTVAYFLHIRCGKQ